LLSFKERPSIEALNGEPAPFVNALSTALAKPGAKAIVQAVVGSRAVREAKGNAVRAQA
jgi:hypothetical protein